MLLKSDETYKKHVASKLLSTGVIPKTHASSLLGYKSEQVDYSSLIGSPSVARFQMMWTPQGERLASMEEVMVYVYK